MAELITSPTFTFNQGDVFDGAEEPIQVVYWDNGDVIELRQDKSVVLIQEDQLNVLFKEILKHLPEAKEYLNSKK